ncbi:hypothetical protein V1478_018897 [Vespula squamosa]|uniref:Uncharacterized protein n=1 Tax=Vespula squamosa TaxID=30214 RepID=A0ABD1ZUH4_VESSQ
MKLQMCKILRMLPPLKSYDNYFPNCKISNYEDRLSGFLPSLRKSICDCLFLYTASFLCMIYLS